MPPRKVPADYHALAEERGFRWVGPEVASTKTKTEWECANGHRWETTHNHIQQGKGCPYCSGKARKVPADYHALAEKRGFQWLGPEVPNIVTKTEWECANGHHRWEATYSEIRQGNGCPYCSRRVPKMPADYHALADKRGFRWVGPVVSTTQIKTGWECANGHHRWEATYSGIRQGNGCPYCSKTLKMPADYHALADKRGFRWVGPEVANTKTKTGWECANGHHRWEATYNDIRQGSGCPECKYIVNGFRTSRPQRDLCDVLAGELNYSCGPYAIDIAIWPQDVPIAVEYDSWFWHAGNEARDARRDRDLITAGWRVVRIKANAQLPDSAEIETSITQLLNGDTYVELVLDDWGVGPTFEDAQAQAAPTSPWVQLDLWSLMDDQG